MSKGLLRFTGILVCLAIIAGFGVLSAGGVFDVPDHIVLDENEERVFDFGVPLKVGVTGESESVIKLNDQTLAQACEIDLAHPVSLSSSGVGETNLHIDILGFPIKSITVSSLSGKKLVPGGESIGVTLFTKGALVVGASDIVDESGESRNPAREAGLLPGDVITRVNGVEIEDASHLTRLVGELKGGSVQITATRDGEARNFTVKPAADSYDGEFRMGVWVRDSTAGVGTLTFYDPANNAYGGLGHAVTDVDTKKQLPIKNGEIVRSQIIEIDKGTSGEPGELRGVFSYFDKKIGSIELNTDFGIYGKIDSGAAQLLSRKPLSVGSQDEITYGPAKIMTTIDDTGVHEYDCEIIKINRQRFPAQKGLVIKVTDPVLLERTGGIVQGMSGSPIIQNGKIVGAVTHVFLNSPEKGYGMFIEWMLEQCDKID